MLAAAETDNAVIYGYNAETGASLYTKNIPNIDTGGYTLATQANGPGEWSSVGDFLGIRKDQLRVAYFKNNIDGSADIKITYYDALTGNAIGSEITIHVPIPPSP